MRDGMRAARARILPPIGRIGHPPPGDAAHRASIASRRPAADVADQRSHERRTRVDFDLILELARFYNRIESRGFSRRDGPGVMVRGVFSPARSVVSSRM